MNFNKFTCRLQRGNNLRDLSKEQARASEGRGGRNAPKICSETVKGPIVTVSCEMMPTAAPEPYFKEIRFCESWKDVDVVGSNSGVPDGHEAQAVVANHKSEEPVSRTRPNDWGLGTRES